MQSKNIHNMKTEANSLVTMTSENLKCSLCYGPIENNHFNINQEVDELLNSMVEKCLPEMETYLKGISRACKSCRKSLEIMYSFVTMALETTVHIKNYCLIKRIEIVALFKVFNFIQLSMETESGKNVTHPDLANLKKAHLNESLKEIETDYIFRKINNNQAPFRKMPVPPKQAKPPKIKLYKCKMCEIQTKYKENLKKHIAHHHQNLQPLECQFCVFQTRYKSAFEQHQFVEMGPVKCPRCDYEPECRGRLKKHQATHKEPFKCFSCTYQTSRRFRFQRHVRALHMDRDKDPDLVACDLCAFKGKDKHGLKSHMISHRSLSEVPVFSCTVCDFRTKRKSNLKLHMDHQHSPDVKWFQCHECEFKTKNRHYLKRHGLVHKDPTEVEMLKCQLCKYKTKYKHSFNSHMKAHRIKEK